MSQLPLLLWQKRQAAMIYHHTSMAYLKEVQRRFNELFQESDQVVDLAIRQGRDRVLEDARWGHRNTVDNWANAGAWGAMADMRNWLAELVALRATETYSETGRYSLAQMISEFSLLWMTPDEENNFQKKFELWYGFASEMDQYISPERLEIGFFRYCSSWDSQKHLIPRLPKFRIRTDIVGESGKTPPRTGVYVSQDDPNAGLQFGWTGAYKGHYMKLPESYTFNELGLRALNYIGRDRLWIDKAKNDEFALLPENRPTTIRDGELEYLWLSYYCFTERPCKWYFVERVNGEYDDEENPIIIETDTTIRALPGEAVPSDGIWYTPALKGSGNTLTLKRGDRLPDTQYTDYGAVIWYRK